MPSESQMWSDHVRPVLYKAGLDPHRIESDVGLGIPDVNYVYGWIELKHVNAWPKRGGPLRMTHFSPQQRVWLSRRWRMKGNAFLLLRVGHEFLMFDGQTASEIIGFAGRELLIEKSLVFSIQGFTYDFVLALKRPR